MPAATELLLQDPAMAAATAYTMAMTMSGLLHRGETHGAVEYHPAVREVGKFATWMLSGMNPKEWELVHRVHHAFTDREPNEEQWEDLQWLYPGSPKDVWQDGHSPIRTSHLHILGKNGPEYRKAANHIVPYVQDLEERAVPREEWPPHLAMVDLSKNWMDRHLYDRKHAGVEGLTFFGATLMVGMAVKDHSVVQGIENTLIIESIHIPAVLGVGGIVNAAGHLGTAKGFIPKMRVMLGKDAPVPNEASIFDPLKAFAGDEEKLEEWFAMSPGQQYAASWGKDFRYASNFFEPVESIAVGEPDHGDHHAHPDEAFISSMTNPLRDPVGVMIRGMEHVKVGGRPLAVAHTNRR